MHTRHRDDRTDTDSSYGPDYGQDDRYDRYRDDDRGWRGGRGLGDRFFDFVRSRRTEHWVMFAAGLVIGAILG